MLELLFGFAIYPIRATQLSSTNESFSNSVTPPRYKMQAREVLLLSCSLLSLVASCILWSPHKQAWMDEIFTWERGERPLIVASLLCHPTWR